MASLNLSINGPSIRSSYESILNGPSTSAPARWALFSVQAPLLNAFQDSGAKESILKVDSTGSGELDELVEDLNDGRIQFAFVRVQDPNTRLPKNVLIAWCGGGVPERTKGYFTSHLTAVSKVLHGYHVQITARSQEDLETESVMKKVADASGAKYSIGSAGPAPARGGAPPPLAKKPVYTPTSSSAANPLVAARNRRQDNVDADGWGADAPPVTRTQLERVAPAYTPTKVNLAELTRQKQPESVVASARAAAASSDVIGGSYQPVGKVDIAAIRAAAKKEDDRPTIVKGAYEPVGKVDIAAIRAAAKNKGDERPATVKGAYEPVGKVDIAAIRAKARPEHDEAPAPAPVPSAPAVATIPLESERLTSLPKPKVASKFGGASAFMGTKAPTPGGASIPKAAPVGIASRTFADEGGKTPAQLWAEKKARESGGGSAAVSSSQPAAAPLSSQASGGEWKSGYKGKSWAPVSTSNFGRAGAVTEQRTGGSVDASAAEPGQAPSSPSGGVSALRDRFKGGAPAGGHQAEEDYSAPPPPIPTASRPTESFAAPSLPVRSAAAYEEPEPEPEPAYEREESPVRIAVPVAREPEPEPEPVVSRPEPEVEPAAAGGAGQTALIQYGYEKAEDNEIDLVEGDYVTNIEQVDPDWWMGTNSRGETGLFPSNYVELVEEEAAHAGGAAAAVAVAAVAVAAEPAVPAPAPAAEAVAGGPAAIAEYDYEAGEDNELSFPEGAKITDIEFPDDDWWFGHYNGQSGLFPSNYVQLQQ